MAKEKKLKITNPQWTNPQFSVALAWQPFVAPGDLGFERPSGEPRPTNTFPDMTKRVYKFDEVIDYEAEWLKAIGE